MDDERVELSGFHAVKHAMRFGAEALEVWTDDRDRAMGLCERLAPDLVDRLDALLVEVSTDDLRSRSDYAHPTHVHGRARRPQVDLHAASGRSPVVHLHAPVDPGNVGAVIRVGAAVGVDAVTVDRFDQLWSPACVRGSAGLHFAVPVAGCDLATIRPARPVVAFDPDGAPFEPASIDPASVLVFGSERTGIPGDLLEAADAIVALPMAEGVSSLNLATSVAAATYAIELVDRHRDRC